jgi:hypothetical protein
MGYDNARLHCDVHCHSLILCAEKSKRYVPSHSHQSGLCMEPCMACGEKRLCHTKQAQKNVATPKSKMFLQPFLWQPQKIFSHIKSVLQFYQRVLSAD